MFVFITYMKLYLKILLRVNIKFFFSFSVLEFHPNNEKSLLFGAGDNTKIYGWDIVTGKEKIILSGHFSKITSLNFHEDGNYLVR